MAAYKTNRLLIVCVVVFGVSSVFVWAFHRSDAKPPSTQKSQPHPSHPIVNTASQDSAAESLDTLTVQWTATEQRVKAVVEENAQLQRDNKNLLQQLQDHEEERTHQLTTTVTQMQSQLQALSVHPDVNANAPAETAEPLQRVPELAESLHAVEKFEKAEAAKMPHSTVKPIYTIPVNATAVQDRLMTALVGRIPVKGVVVDPYPFKIVFADDTLAANGLRVPNLRQMIVSGYTEGDLNLASVRGWVTSLTFVFQDGRISTTSSNDNNIGRYSKENALGYLSDASGNPFIRGKLITNALTYVGVNVALGAAQGAANAYAQSQTTAGTISTGTATSSVTGSSSAFIAGQAGNNAISQVQQWWRDRAEQSFDAIYVPTMTEKNHPQTVAVNFTKEIHIDYDEEGRKLVYAKNISDTSDHRTDLAE